MPVIDVSHDVDALTLTITAEFAAPIERIWQVYADPRQLEKVWGPPTHPATFVEHDLTPGGRMSYFMLSPEGEKYAGYWTITTVDAPHGFTFEDGFADSDFTPDPDMPVSANAYSFTEHDGGTRAIYLATYQDAAGLQKTLDMGVVEGATTAINQIDEHVATSAAD